MVSITTHWYGENFHTPRRAYQTSSEKQTGFLSRSIPRPRDIRVYKSGFSRPIVHRTYIRHRTYSTKVTSFPSNLPLHRIIRLCISHARSINISICFHSVKIFFVIFIRKFQGFFVHCRQRKIWEEKRLFLPYFVYQIVP